MSSLHPLSDPGPPSPNVVTLWLGLSPRIRELSTKLNKSLKRIARDKKTIEDLEAELSRVKASLERVGALMYYFRLRSWRRR